MTIKTRACVTRIYLHARGAITRASLTRKAADKASASLLTEHPPFMRAELSLFTSQAPPTQPAASGRQRSEPRQQVDNEGRAHRAEGTARVHSQRRSRALSFCFFLFFSSSCFQPVCGCCWRVRILRCRAADLERDNSARRLLPRL